MKKETSGTVTMSLQEYNNLYKKLLRYEQAVKVTAQHSDYNDSDYYYLNVSVNLEAFREVIEDQYEDLNPDIMEQFNEDDVRWNDRRSYDETLASKTVEKEKA